MKTLPRHLLVATLLDALEEERHLRVPLLLTLLDELEAEPPFAPAAAVAQGFLGALQRAEIDDADFACAIAELRARLRAPWSGPSAAASPRTPDQRAARSASDLPAA
jgi:hypothetical protein